MKINIQAKTYSTDPHEYTMEEVIKMILKNKHDSGHIGIYQEEMHDLYGSPSCIYELGKLVTYLPHYYLNKIADKIKYDVVCGKVDYLITIKK